MSSSRSIIEPLYRFSTMPQYSKPLVLDKKMEFYQDFKCEYEYMSNSIQILPPSVWFSIDETRCFSSIKNDAERSRQTRMGLFVTNSKGNLLNRITSLNLQSSQEDIGIIQQTQQSFCVSFSVVKDTCDQYLKHIGAQLRSCMFRKPNLIDVSHLKISQLDQISRLIYSKYRIFLIFDAKSQPGRILSIQSCFYPNIRFFIQRIKKKQKQNLKFSPNQVLQQIQRGELLNTFGYMSLDKKLRLLMIKKDDPQLSKDSLIGIWVIGSYPAKRTKKQFGKQDAIWAALLDFYTNVQVKNKLSILQNQKGFLCYFGFKKQRSKLDSPEYYLFQPNLKIPPKWSFLTKSQFVTDWTKSYEVKIEFLNNTIMEEREYSQFSDQTNTNEEFRRNKNQNFNRQNISKQDSKTNIKNNQFISNESGISGSSQSQGKAYEGQKQNKNNQQQDQKSKLIKQLKAELQKYKQRCIQLEAINKLLMQQKIMNQNPMLYPNQFSMMNHQPPPIYHQYGQVSGFPYPLSYSQVSSPSYHQMPTPPINTSEQIRSKQSEIMSPINNPPLSPSNQKYGNIKVSQNYNIQQSEKQKKATFSFPQQKPQQMSFGNQKFDQMHYKKSDEKEKLFIKKSQSYGAQNEEIQTKPILRQQQKLKINSQNQRQIPIKKDLRNISFQDSFAEYHSDNQEQMPNFKFGHQNEYGRFGNVELQKKSIAGHFGSSKKEKKEEDHEDDTNFVKSPQFKRIFSLQPEIKKQNQIQKIGNQNRQLQTKAEKKQPFSKNIDIQPKSKSLIKIKQSQIRNQNKEKETIKQKDIIAKKYGKKIESSSNQQQEQVSKKTEIKKNTKIPQKQIKQFKRQIEKKSDSEDSDEDANLKKLRSDYLRRR